MSAHVAHHIQIIGDAVLGGQGRETCAGKVRACASPRASREATMDQPTHHTILLQAILAQTNEPYNLAANHPDNQFAKASDNHRSAIPPPPNLTIYHFISHLLSRALDHQS